MKKPFIFWAVCIICAKPAICQSLKLGFSVGSSVCFSTYYDLQIDPQKTFTTVEPTFGLSMDYIPFKSRRLSLETGISFVQFSNAFKVEDAPYFPHKEGFPKVKQSYNGIKVPICLGYNFEVGKRLRFNTSLGVGVLQIGRASFYEYRQEVIDRNINKINYSLDYEFKFRSINKTLLCLEYNTGVEYKANKMINIGFFINSQQGIKPILGSILKYKIINNDANFTLIGDSYVTSKGDAVSMLVSIKYKMGKEVKNDPKKNLKSSGKNLRLF
jgi:hypothetical protein